MLLTGEPITWHWLGLIPVMLMQTMFNAGLCMMVARWTAASQDVTQLVPFVMTTWRYLSGVILQHHVFTETSPRGSATSCSSTLRPSLHRAGPRLA